MTIEVNIFDIIIPKERMRYVSGQDIKDLAKSIMELGQLVPIIVHKNPVDKKYTLLAGFRRLQAMRYLGRTSIIVLVRGGLDEYKKLKIEFEENVRRKNLKLPELVRASSKLKRIYLEAHPETKQGVAGAKARWKDSNTKPESGSAYSEADKILMQKGSITDIKPKVEYIEKEQEEVPRFSKALAGMASVSESTAKDVIQVGEAIEAEKIDKKIIEKFDKGQMSFSKVLKEVRRVEREEKQKKKPKVKKKKSEPEPKPEPLVSYCMDCKGIRATICPHCGERLINCSNRVLIKDYESEACEFFEE